MYPGSLLAEVILIEPRRTREDRLGEHAGFQPMKNKIDHVMNADEWRLLAVREGKTPGRGGTLTTAEECLLSRRPQKTL